MSAESWFFLFTFIGVLVGTFLHYLKKKITEPQLSFDHRYAYTAIVTIIITKPVTFFLDRTQHKRRKLEILTKKGFKHAFGLHAHLWSLTL